MQMMGYAFFYVDVSHANHEFQSKFIAKYHGYKVDDESSFIILERGEPEKTYVGLRIDHALSRPKHEGKILEVRVPLLLLLLMPAVLLLTPPLSPPLAPSPPPHPSFPVVQSLWSDSPVGLSPHQGAGVSAGILLGDLRAGEGCQNRDAGAEREARDWWQATGHHLVQES